MFDDLPIATTRSRSSRARIYLCARLGGVLSEGECDLPTITKRECLTALDMQVMIVQMR